MNKITPLVKGLITGSVMLAATLLLFYTKQPADSPLRYIVFVLYAGGIAWTLLAYYRSPEYTGKFGDMFGKGFRCFIIVILIMVLFTGIFSSMHPEFAKTDANNYEKYLKETKMKDRTPAQIDEMVASYQKHYTTGLIYSAIFGTLIMGVIFTAAGAGLLLMRRK